MNIQTNRQCAQEPSTTVVLKGYVMKAMRVVLALILMNALLEPTTVTKLLKPALTLVALSLAYAKLG